MTLERATPWVLGSLIVVFLLQTTLSVWNDSATFDENINPAVGYAELFIRDYSLYHDHPPLIRVFTALPLLAFQPNVPLNHDSWQKRAKGTQDRYDFAHEFFYVANSNAGTMLFWSRMPVIFLSLVLGLLVFKWAKALYGNLAGLFSLFLYTFEPNIIAHSRLATTDLILTLFIFCAVFQFWQYYQSPSLKALILTGILFGLALLSKFSAIMLLPILFLLAFLVPKKGEIAELTTTLWSLKSRVTGEAMGRIFKTMCLVSIIAVGVLLAFYGSQWELYIKGFSDTMSHYEKGHNAFLMGNHSTDGWWHYFPVAFLLKTPIPLLIYVLVSFLFLSFRKEKAGYFLLVPIGVITISALFSHINIGLRHILPIYPFLIVLASSVTLIRFSQPRFFSACFVCLGFWYAFSTASIFPSYLAYFNEFVGPKKGYRQLVDSNLDWGQDLKRLRTFLDKNDIDHVYLGYFGTADPCYYGIKPIDLPGPPSRCGRGREEIQADYIAISATHLQSVYFADKKTFSWLLPYEPVARIGYSIFVYDIQGDAGAHNNLGILFLRHGQFMRAVEEFKQVAELSPEDATAYVNLGFTHARMAAFEEAEQAYEKALQLDPQNPIARAGLQGIRRRKKETQSF